MKNIISNYKIFAESYMYMGFFFVDLHVGYNLTFEASFNNQVFVELKPHYYDWLKENMKLDSICKPGVAEQWFRIEPANRNKYFQWLSLINKDDTFVDLNEKHKNKL